MAAKPHLNLTLVHDSRPLVRIVIVGEVDHGKSTLIGRLLHETGSLPDGKLEALKQMSARRGMPFEWSFLLDALQSERDQGITIDTSQIRFRTPSRDVLLIDAPGHAEFLRNMITGAAQADAALLLVDAAEGVRDQTRRHGYLLHLLGVRQVAVIVNKMDRVGFDPNRFDQIRQEIGEHLAGFGLSPAAIVPVCAREGDGIATITPPVSWYEGPTVLGAIDAFAPARRPDAAPLRLPVQAVYKFDERRILSGRIEAGTLAVGEEITVLPSGRSAKVKSIESWPSPVGGGPQRAVSGQSIGITLDRELFVSRGDVIALPGRAPVATKRLSARLFWLHDQPLTAGTTLTVRIATAEVRATVLSISNAVDPGRLSDDSGSEIAQNHIGDVVLDLSRPLAVDSHDVSPRTGRVVLDLHGRIAGGGLVLTTETEVRASPKNTPKSTHIVAVDSSITADERRGRFGHGGAVVWLTGLPGAGKSTLALALERRLFGRGGNPVVLDGDTLRSGLNADLGFSAAERAENVRRLGEVGAHLARSGVVAIVAAVSPAAADRAAARRAAAERFYEIHVATSAEVCETRDPKGHYRKARAGEIAGFSGIDNSYQSPPAAELTLDTATLSIEQSVDAIERLLAERGVVDLSEAPQAIAS